MLSLAHYGKGHPRNRNISEENRKLIDDYCEERLKLYESSESTVGNYRNSLNKFADFIGNKSIKDAKSEDTKNFFKKNNMATHSKRTIGNHIILFYRDLEELESKERPTCMKWFVYPGFKRQDKDIYDREKTFVTRGEIDALIKFSRYDCEKALWETFYLTGARPKDLEDMTIKDVVEEEGKVVVVLPISKTDPRKIPLPEDAQNLIRWVGNHPLRDNPDAPLWLSNTYRTMNQKLSRDSYGEMLITACKRAGIKRLTPKAFRKTRATKYFEDYEIVNGQKYHKWNDKEIGMIFGWNPETVVKRRQEYDLTGFEELKEKIFESTPKIETFDSIKAERDRLKKKHDKEIAEQKEKIEGLKEILNIVADNMSGLANTELSRNIKNILDQI